MSNGDKTTKPTIETVLERIDSLAEQLTEVRERQTGMQEQLTEMRVIVVRLEEKQDKLQADLMTGLKQV